MSCLAVVVCYRDNTNQTNESILKILSDTVKTNIATEDRISKRLHAILSDGSPSRGTPRSPPLLSAAAAGGGGTGDRLGSASSNHAMTSSPRKHAATHGGT